jgi:hypothetical protein
MYQERRNLVYEVGWVHVGRRLTLVLHQHHPLRIANLAKKKGSRKPTKPARPR